MARKKRSNKTNTQRRRDKPRNNQSNRNKNKRDNQHRRGKNRRGKHRQQSYEDGSFEIELKAMANGGFALGTHNRRTTFVPYTIPGEVVRATVVEQQKNVDFAAGIELLEASADRVYPQCPHFGPGQCWGCQWQHIDYQAQLLLKQDVLADQLYRVGNYDDNVIEKALQPVVPSPTQWAYNENITMVRDTDGNFGYYQIDGRTVEAIDECHVLHPDLQGLFTMIDIDFEDLERMQLWRGTNSDTMIILEMSSDTAPQLTADFPTSVNIVLPDNEPVNLVGDSRVIYEVGRRTFRVTAGGAFRANITQIDNLIATILDMLELNETDSVLDLYAGVGVFSAFLANRAELVTLVESYPPTATDAEENLTDFENVDIVEGNVEDVLPVLIEAEAFYHAAVIDPPSSGMSRDAKKALLQLDIPRVVYISSDPATLARDSRQFVDAGYELVRVQPIDFAPQTYYIDAVALLVKQ